MDAEIGLTVAVEVEHTDRDATGDRLLVDPGGDQLPPPRDLAGKTDVDGQHPHRVPSPFARVVSLGSHRPAPRGSA